MDWLAAMSAVVPSIGVGLIFWLVVRSMLRADRTEREHQRRLDLQERAATAPEGDDPRS